jgi:peptidoglycan/xylan/chitin deacetylase (PgdA/CDA1 family)
MKLPILTYHKIGPERHSKYWTTTSAFEEQMKLLHCMNYTPIWPHDILSGITCDSPVLLTFDDGYKNFLTYAYPILKRFGFKSVCFVITNYAGKLNEWEKYDTIPPQKHMSWDEILMLKHEGLVSFQSHGVSHMSLVECESKEERLYELSESKRVLESVLSEPVYCFAYPYGHQTEVIQKEVSEAGYSIAFSCIHEIEDTDTADLFALKRIGIYS